MPLQKLPTQSHTFTFMMRQQGHEAAARAPPSASVAAGRRLKRPYSAAVPAAARPHCAGSCSGRSSLASADIALKAGCAVLTIIWNSTCVRAGGGAGIRQSVCARKQRAQAAAGHGGSSPCSGGTATRTC